MRVSNQTSSKIFHMSLAEPLIVLILSALGVALAVGLFWAGIGDFIKTIVLLAIAVYGLVLALTMTRKLEIAGSELIVSYLASKRVIAREDVDAYFLDEQGWNRHTRKFVSIHLINGRRINFKRIQEGDAELLQALESFTGFKAAVEQPQEAEEHKQHE